MIFDRYGVKKLAAQGILTYSINRTLPYHLYADEFDLFVFGASLPSASLSKNEFFDRLGPGLDDRVFCHITGTVSVCFPVL